MQKLKDYYKEVKFSKLQRKKSHQERKATKELSERRLKNLQQRILDPNHEEDVKSALLLEQLTIHHNHEIARQLKKEEHSWLIDTGKYGTVFYEENDPDFVM